MATTQTRGATTTTTGQITTSPANGDTAKARKPKGTPTPPEKRVVRMTMEQYVRIALATPRSLGDLIDGLDERDSFKVQKALKALAEQGIVAKGADGKWARKA